MTRTLDSLARKLENENIAQAYDMGRDKERAAVVAYLRSKFPEWPAGSNGYADEIERGEHRQDKP